MKKINNHTLFLIIAFLGFTVLSWGQTDLVRWNNINYTPTIVASNISASTITVAGGVTIGHQAWGNSNNFFQIGNWPSSLDTNKYVEFTISADTGYLINLNNFNFTYRAGWTPLTFVVRYSKDNFTTFQTTIGETNATTNWTNVSADISALNPISPNQTVKIRIYTFVSSGADFQIKRLMDAGSPTNYTQTPRITGTVSVANPIAVNDVSQTSENTPAVVDILGNDIYGTLNTITITQAPANGNIVVNGLSDVTYTPNTSYIGTDSFKYRITDQIGISNEATVTMNVMVPTPPTAVADSFTAPSGQPTVLNVLANDTPGSSDFDYITIINSPSNGNAVLNPNNTITYTANNTFTGTDSFQYDVTNLNNLTSNTVTVTLTVPCNCTHTVSGGTITVNNGEVYCLNSGSWSGGVRLNAGGTICVAEGATFNMSHLLGNSAVNGTIINRGTVTQFTTYNDTNHTGTIENYGTFNSSNLQHFNGTILNYGELNVTGQLTSPAASTGTVIHNYGDITVSTISFHEVEVNNYNGAEFTTTSGVNVYSGYWDNRFGGEVYLNGTQIIFIGDLDNSGYWEFERLQTLTSTLNNYGHMKVSNVVNSITSDTYITNDDLLEFVNVSDVQYNGPMLTNNGTITVTHGTAGNFKMNMAINQVFNNGLIDVSGQFEQNAAGSLLVNNCTVECSNFLIREGITENNGLIWASLGVEIQGAPSSLKNAITGHIRGTNFTNSGEVSGYGGFYFTGNTNMNTGGSFIGDEPNSILFFDASQTGSNIFDTPGGTVANVIRPDTMIPYDTDSYDCVAPPSVAGSPPFTEPVIIGMCEPGNANFDIDDYATPADPVGGDPFVLLHSTIKLFEYNNVTNPYNNSPNLVIAGKGTFSANITTGVITFTRHPSFISGAVEAEYRISNKRAGDPITYPSPRARITITINTLGEIIIEEGQSPVCNGETITLSNPDSGGVWSSDNSAIATVDANGVVTGISAGQTTISYTKYFENGDCEIEKDFQIEVEMCSSPGGKKLITNPHIRQRTK